MENFTIFIPIQKVDIEKRLVYGTMTHETPDASGEIMDYESAKPEFEKWSNETMERSKGQSKGNVRAMHTSIAAGKLTDIVFDDERKSIEGVAKIVDDAEWNKVLEGVYTGFSIGGRYAKRWQDPKNSKLMRFTPIPSEVSIVDNPCCPTAVFSMVKADGSVVQKAFKHKENTVDKDALKKAATAKLEQGWLTPDKVFYPKKEDALEHTIEKEISAVEKREFSDKKRKELADKGHAMPDGSFPIESEGDLKNAIRAIGRAKDPEKAKAHIIARAKEMKLTNLLPADWEGSDKSAEVQKEESMAEVKKGMDDVARTACIIEHLNWLSQCVSMEEKMEGDEESDSPAHLEEIIKELCEYLVTRVAEETKEIIDHQELEEMVMELAAGMDKESADALHKQLSGVIKFDGKPVTEESTLHKFRLALAKAGARHSKADNEHGAELHKALKDMHGHMEDMGKCMDKMKKCGGAMEECHKSAMDHTESMGFGKAKEEPEEGDDAEKAKAATLKKVEDEAKAAADTKAGGVSKIDTTELKKVQDDFTAQLKKVKDEANAAIALATEAAKSEIKKAQDEKAELEKKHKDFADSIELRLKTIEGQPMPNKGAVFDVAKGHGDKNRGNDPVEAKVRIPVVNRSPEEQRALLGMD